jgi:4-hydroxythreonine-4-phosphate dehydrogenase
MSWTGKSRSIPLNIGDGMTATALPRIAISLGDPAGIGPEIALKAIGDARVLAVCTPVLIGDHRILKIHAALCGITLSVAIVKTIEEIGSTPPGGPVELLDIDLLHGEALAMGEIRAVHGRAAIEAADAAIRAALKHKVDAVIACPQTELAIHRAGIAFDGYPSFVARTTGTPAEDAFLMLCFDDKRIVHTTLHVGLSRAISLITRERVGRVVAETHATLGRQGIAAPRIAVAGLNPHASENGLFGDEELRVIGPALDAAKAAGIKVEGPLGADTMFQRAGFDAFVVMYHDQGHIAAKLLATNRTAGMTIGTPILFSSVAHGSALDIAGKNLASPEAVIEAVQRLATAAAATAKAA